MKTGTPGCEHCNSSRDSLPVVYEELRDRAFVRVEFYQHDRLHRCPTCKMAWLAQYWETDTPETMLQEWGERHGAWTALSLDDVAAIEAALAAGVALPHDRFHQ